VTLHGDTVSALEESSGSPSSKQEVMQGTGCPSHCARGIQNGWHYKFAIHSRGHCTHLWAATTSLRNRPSSIHSEGDSTRLLPQTSGYLWSTVKHGECFASGMSFFTGHHYVVCVTLLMLKGEHGVHCPDINGPRQLQVLKAAAAGINRQPAAGRSLSDTTHFMAAHRVAMPPKLDPPSTRSPGRSLKL
jgi:hypothetical protein